MERVRKGGRQGAKSGRGDVDGSGAMSEWEWTEGVEVLGVELPIGREERSEGWKQ